jgi:hypothetical protein
MEARQINRLFKAFAALLLAAAVLVAVTAFRAPKVATPTGPATSTHNRREVSRIAEAPALTEFAALWDKPLRSTPPPAALVGAEGGGDSESEEGESISQAAEQIRVSLVGTILESGRSKAIFIGPDGKLDLKGIGQDLELAPRGMRVESIQLASVILSYQGEIITLRLPAPERR